MAILHVLGSGAVRTDPHRTTTMLALETERSALLIDCGGDVVQRALAAGIPEAKLLHADTALVLTHEHADHVGGFPLLLERLWLLGLRRPLPVYGIEPAIAQARRIHDAFDTSQWPEYGGADYCLVEHRVDAPVLQRLGLEVTATPGTHTVPTVALRFEVAGGGSVTYSGDSTYDPRVVELARESDLLVHEATCTDSGCGVSGHATALEAATVARDAAVARLLLVHLPPAEQIDPTLGEARAVFPNLSKAEELQRIRLLERADVALEPAVVHEVRA